MDAYDDEYTFPKDDIGNGGKNDLQILGREISNEGVTTIKFKRLLNTSKFIIHNLKMIKMILLYQKECMKPCGLMEKINNIKFNFMEIIKDNLI